ncbi:PREDICTED: translocon-associated protein subunit beta-like isoform X1 [Lupinus angustifolius]|uniref:translocon-associated protein subunit beta-like isoform X1 n=1 Tax=Lupinus angustifolius TaxID=3871 RepID=UPI00092ED8FE|nr:PREDICTED: translocon-associated protein subunit beta-like isoform X1 [Lupinus angustifolius]
MADFMSKTLIALALIASFLLCSSHAKDSDVPFIVVHKKATINKLKSGTEGFSVTIDIYNQGTSTAYDISLADENWPNEAFKLISGSTSKSWEKLDAGGVLSNTFELESKEKGAFSGEPAIVKFRVATKADLQEAYSNPIKPLDILGDRVPEKKFEWAKRLLHKFGPIVSVFLIVVLFVQLIISPSKSSAKGSKKRR